MACFYGPPPLRTTFMERYGSILSTGIRIFHARRDYPHKIIFWRAKPEALIEQIREVGFLPTAPASSQITWHGVPLRLGAPPASCRGPQPFPFCISHFSVS